MRDLADTDAGYDTAATGADQTIDAAHDLTTDYAADTEITTKVQENKNGASQIRTGRSSGVAALAAQLN
ncbi:hypothetical protein [Candidatus Poriferisodalis sp.]|uniref:hypothetical protein n=1 Tax=Candidatus Poriferisodalis sp. TaxID=3101277 RepID=UPI003B5ADF59